MRILAAGACALFLAVALQAGSLQPGPQGLSVPASPSATSPRSCSDLARLALPDTTITLAQAVDAGAFAPPGAGNAGAFRALPAFCRVAATLRPSRDSEINVEVWLPASGWNGKLQAVGNGAFNGTIAYAAMAPALAAGYAASSTDTGHAGGSASFALGHPEKVIDFGWRAVHELAETSKNLVQAYYGVGPKFSYWVGCSAGGRQGMKEAQKFPADFDGIIAGAPGLDWTGRAAQALRIEQALAAQSARLLQPERQLLHRAVVDACDVLDGVKDGVIDSPARCTFDPAVLQCKTSDQTGCLTRPQVDTARLIYSAAKDPKTGRDTAGLLPGSELGWTDTGWTASARASGLDQFRFIVFGNPNWTVQQFNAETDLVRADQADNGIINALDPNLAPFIARGGKLIQYHGWSDPQISPANSTEYYARAVATSGGAATVHGSYRLFMAPGMAHCGGGEGPNSFDMVSALEQWVEHGKAPDHVIASRATNGKVDRTRPLCPYPQVAAYRGAGSTDEASSFVCKAP
ncbi:MAG: tannase/feruloyl esterase family alpha/beta hydrolase [Acidobacteria bacterium]|nr:tannase/feruloyl esterase family alpha/beta hydrolase [Acidobacteriota bacterium]